MKSPKFIISILLCVSLSYACTDKENLFIDNLKSASNLNGNLNCSKELEHYAS